LDAEVLTGGEYLGREVKAAFGSDMMSDVLAFVKDQSMLLTGLVNPQVVRTAEMMDINGICFVRGKRPDDAIVSLAAQKKIVLLCTKRRMFSACGILYSAGVGAGGNE
jgi:predicted transcriptional regulator